ncbi:MAG: ATP-binding protein [Chloroflexi bacterium]|nr:ATP-binding protein [Chloroflexota bacterium]
MQDFEKLGLFYLGKLYNLAQKELQDELLLYRAKDLVTHAVCVGMTGSGKTGLCLDLIEEAAIDGIPAILIDPKGDLGNLLLTFPQLRGEDFLPWINVDEARTKGLSPEDYANQQAELWKKGLASWGQSEERIQMLREAADFAIYTPGSSAGLPVSILASFAVPPQAVIEDRDLLRERVGTTVNSLLSLMGIAADPLQSREHILLSNILDSAWRQGQDVDLGTLIQQVQKPPFAKIGVLDLESFYPAKDRFALVMSLNGLLASPGFETWLEGQPLDVDQILYTPQGKPRMAIFSIAHLSDAERMFFVSLLLNQVLGWMRTQSGTTTLRAILYMDEIFGYLPPVANPPSKQPMLTLLKQARAFGLGIVLATQNPVDLDYKALSNTSTWFIGRLQTERDKARLLDGLQGAAVTTGMAFDRQNMEQTLAALGNRVFLMNNVHDDAPVTFQTRWAMSYLRGPLTREHIKDLMEDYKRVAAPAATAHPPVAPAQVISPVQPVGTPIAQAPTLPPDVPAYFVPSRGNAPTGSSLVYRPTLLGAARIRFADTRTRVDLLQDVVFTTVLTEDPIPVNWDNAQMLSMSVADLEKTARAGARYVDLPPLASQARSYTSWSRDFANWLYANQQLELLRSPNLGQVSKPGESERDFRIRLQLVAHERRDEAVDKLRQKYAPRITSLQNRLRTAQQKVQREAEQARHKQMQAAMSAGTTLIGALFGGKTSRSTLSGASTAARGFSQSLGQRQDVARAQDNVEALEKQLADLEAQLQADVANLEARMDPQQEILETLPIRPKKTDISVQLVTLAWAPYWQDAQGMAMPAW